MQMMVKVLTLACSVMFANTVIAAPYSHERHDHPEHRQHWQHKQHIPAKNRIHPSREWRSGQILPRQFQSSRYVVNYKNDRRLPRPNRNQQWLKINGDYVLINQFNQRILHIMA